MALKLKPPEDESPHESALRLLFFAFGVFVSFPLIVMSMAWLFGESWFLFPTIIVMGAWLLFLRAIVNGKIQVPAMTWDEEQRRKKAREERSETD